MLLFYILLGVQVGFIPRPLHRFAGKYYVDGGFSAMYSVPENHRWDEARRKHQILGAAPPPQSY